MNSYRTETAIKEPITQQLPVKRTTIGLRQTTKDKLNKNRAPGQCYDGFILQLVELWEEVKTKNLDYIRNPIKGEVVPIRNENR
jgi:hypothetical protein